MWCAQHAKGPRTHASILSPIGLVHEGPMKLNCQRKNKKRATKTFVLAVLQPKVSTESFYRITLNLRIALFLSMNDRLCNTCYVVSMKQVTPPRRTSPFLHPDKGWFLHRFCCLMLMQAVTQTPFTHIHHTLKRKHILSTSIIIYKYIYFHISPIYLHLVVSSTSWHGREGIMHR
jgi:hypothetical protein